ncbi:hypothetical protein GTR00_21360, partial [Kineococcus sp. T90]
MSARTAVAAAGSPARAGGVLGRARRHPSAVFWVLAPALTWAVWVPRALHERGLLEAGWAVPLGAAWSWGPALAAVLAAALCGG